VESISPIDAPIYNDSLDKSSEALLFEEVQGSASECKEVIGGCKPERTGSSFTSLE